MALLEITDLTVKYGTSKGTITAVSDASFSLDEGEYLGLVGESGCGKSTIAKAIMGGLSSNGRITSGTICYDGMEIQDFSEEELNRRIRWKEISFIPQSSMNSLDPLQRISDQAVQIAQTHTDLTKREAKEKFKQMFETVGLPEERISQYPHQFSGGMQQRVIIALALFLEPSIIVADEPTTALDVIMQDQIFKYIDQIKETLDTSMLLITHDISVVFESCDSIAIMHAGQIAETGSTADVFTAPHHPYSILLQRAFPDIRHPDRELEVIDGNPPKLEDDVNYCTFKDRCPWATEKCRENVPRLESVLDGDGAHYAACFHKKTVRNEVGPEVSQDV